MDDWEEALEGWKAELANPGWVTLAEAEAATGVSRSALRSWYRKGELDSRVEEGPHGPQRLVQLDAVVDRVATSPRLGRRSPPIANDDAVHRLIDLLAAQIERAEARAERAEAALLTVLMRSDNVSGRQTS